MIAALDWGLGHAARCVPLVRELLALQCEIILTGSGKSLSLLTTEFPELTAYELSNHGLNFSSNLSINIQVIRQFSKLKHAIKKEHTELLNILKTHQVDAIISDNRYGIYSENIPSVLLTHQLDLAPGTPLRYFGQRQLKKRLALFDEFWVPDEHDSLLSGELSSTDVSNKTYIGSLSRFKKLDIKRQDFILVLASGTEPHRTEFETKITSELAEIETPVVLLRGMPHEVESSPSFPSNFTVYSHLESERLNELLCSCSMLVSRNGYSTLMDVVRTETPFVFIQTDGQSEQEYLAKHLKESFQLNTLKLKDFSPDSLKYSKSILTDSQIDLNTTLKTWLVNL